MSEQLRHNNEKSHESDHLVDATHERRIHEKHKSDASKARHEHQENLETIRRSIEANAEKSESIKIDTSETNSTESNPHFVSSSMRNYTLNQSLKSIRRNLSPTEKQFSHIIHNQVVDQVSEVTAKTIARPSGLLVGGIAAFCSSVAVMVICRYFGYEYNYFIGIAAFIAGFALGLVLEAIYKLSHRAH